MRLKDKVVIVTGATSGIGRVSAILFGQEGARVVAVGRREVAGQETVEGIKKNGGEGIFLKADVSKGSEVREMVSKVLKVYGRINILFNNAGINPESAKKPLAELSEKDWDRVMDVNVKGIFLTSKYVVPEMIKIGGGAIVNTSSYVGRVAIKNRSVYIASKGAVTQLTKSMALDYASFNIRVNSVSPGAVETEMTSSFLESTRNSQRIWECFLCRYPIGRIGKPKDVAHAVLFLVSEESSWITGADLVVEGGYLAR